MGYMPYPQITIRLELLTALLAFLQSRFQKGSHIFPKLVSK
jgi:hypothetical protein